jgi:hypothetical protein
VRLLDLFCGAGGAAMGYHRAGFDVIGVDIEPQPRYPFAFVQADAIDFLAEIVGGAEFFPQPSGISDMARLISLRGFSAVHASPPCQAYTSMRSRWPDRAHPELIEPTRELLERIGLPYVIENVQGSDLRRDLTLCGEMFGLDVIRHRYFECSFPVTQPAHIPHRGRVRGWRHGLYHDGPYLAVYGQGGGKGTVTEWQQAMGIDWTADRKAIAEAIPPAYTEHVGLQLAAHLTRKVAA